MTTYKEKVYSCVDKIEHRFDTEYSTLQQVCRNDITSFCSTIQESRQELEGTIQRREFELQRIQGEMGQTLTLHDDCIAELTSFHHHLLPDEDADFADP